MDISRPYNKVVVNEIYDVTYLNKDMTDFENVKFYMRHSSICGDNRFAQCAVHYTDIKKGGVYKITLNNTIYIGQTKCFLDRFNFHVKSKVNLSIDQMLKNGAVFDILEIENDKKTRLLLEAKYIKEYKNNEEWDCININDGFSNKLKRNKTQKYIKVSVADYDKAVSVLKKAKVQYE